jgi:hypothetical protein
LIIPYIFSNFLFASYLFLLHPSVHFRIRIRLESASNFWIIGISKKPFSVKILKYQVMLIISNLMLEIHNIMLKIINMKGVEDGKKK